MLTCAGRGDEASIQSVGPTVIRALKTLHTALAVHDFRSSMAADVHESVKVAGLVACDHYGGSAGTERKVVTGRGDLRSGARELPRVTEDPVLLEREDRGIAVPVRREKVRDRGLRSDSRIESDCEVAGRESNPRRQN